MKKVILLGIGLITGCVPYPRYDWANAKYYGQVIGDDGKPVENALVIVKNNNPFKNVVQVATTDNHGAYEIKPIKVFMLFYGAGLAMPPECIDEIYVVHPEYNVYFKKRQFRGKYARLCTDIETQKNFGLSRKGTSRKAENYEKLSWENAKNGAKLYSYDELNEALILKVNQEDNKIVVKYEETGYEQTFAPRTLEELQSIWYVKKSKN